MASEEVTVKYISLTEYPKTSAPKLSRVVKLYLTNENCIKTIITKKLPIILPAPFLSNILSKA